jgi:hypothetical protein
LYIDLENERARISSYYLSKSRFLTDLVASVPDFSVAQSFDFPLPRECLQGWVTCSRRTGLVRASIPDLILCVLVCFCLGDVASILLNRAYFLFNSIFEASKSHSHSYSLVLPLSAGINRENVAQMDL